MSAKRDKPAARRRAAEAPAARARGFKAPAARARGFHGAWGPTFTNDGVRFRLWGPAQERVALRLDGAEHPMRRDADGWFEVTVPDARPGADYAFALGDGKVTADPASRAQPGDVHAPSRLIDPAAHRWRADWRGRPWADAVIMEIHVGAFTPEGTFAAAAERLPRLAEIGVTAIELMPVAHFAGSRGWGYDGVLPYAPHPTYGAPDDLRALVDAAHDLGLMMLLDVVYNHFGPDGNYLRAYAPDFFDGGAHTPWGEAIAYHREPVRRFFIDNALYWLEDFRFDGLRLDAVDYVRDPGSDTEILEELAATVRREITDRPIHLTTEDNRNITRLHARAEDGTPRLYTAEWNDDLHNVAHAIATGETDGYYIDFAEDHWGKFARALAEGFAYQGQISKHQGNEPRGEPSGHLPPLAFVDFIQNHDQIGNRAFGERLLALTSHAMARALGTILLLSPHVPLMFMGEEWGETRPFAFFTDFHGELADAVREGRRREFADFAMFEDPASREEIPDPNEGSTFEASRIDWDRRNSPDGRDWLAFTAALLALRHHEIVPHLERAPGGGGTVVAVDDGMVAVDWRLDGAVLRLRANLSTEPREAPEAAGRVIHLTPGAPPGAPLPPCAVLVVKDEGPVAGDAGPAARSEGAR